MGDEDCLRLGMRSSGIIENREGAAIPISPRMPIQKPVDHSRSDMLKARLPRLRRPRTSRAPAADCRAIRPICSLEPARRSECRFASLRVGCPCAFQLPVKLADQKGFQVHPRSSSPAILPAQTARWVVRRPGRRPSPAAPNARRRLQTSVFLEAGRASIAMRREDTCMPSRININTAVFVGSVALIVHTLAACSGLSQSGPASAVSSTAPYPDVNERPPSRNPSADQEAAQTKAQPNAARGNSERAAAQQQITH